MIRMKCLCPAFCVGDNGHFVVLYKIKTPDSLCRQVPRCSSAALLKSTTDLHYAGSRLLGMLFIQNRFSSFNAGISETERDHIRLPTLHFTYAYPAAAGLRFWLPLSSLKKWLSTQTDLLVC